MTRNPEVRPVPSPDMLQLLRKYHGSAAARRRLRATRVEQVYGDLQTVHADLRRIRACAVAWQDSTAPQVSIVVPVYNEEIEVVPTILTLLWGIHEAGVPAEILAVDNGSTDRSRALLEGMGIRVVHCDTAGLRFARAAGLAASHAGARYVWLVDADTRLLAPLQRTTWTQSPPNPLRVAYAHLEAEPACSATSTGIVFEYQVPLRRLLRRLRWLVQGGLPYSCWTGPNQFLRKSHLLAAGGIDLAVDGGEDHHRIFQLVRFGSRHGFHVRGADRDPRLLAPVYTSDRRNATLRQISRNLLQQLRKPVYPRDELGLPLHPPGVRHKDLFRRERGTSGQRT